MSPDWNVKLLRLICEIRYNPSLLFSDAKILNDISKNSGLPLSQKNADGALAIADIKNKIFGLVNQHSCAFTLENPSDFPSFASKASQFSANVLERLDVTEISRIGIRANWMIHMDNINNASQIVFNSLIGSSIHQIFDNISLPSVAFTKMLTDTRAINVGVRAEIQRVVEVIQNKPTLDETYEGIMIDIDMYDQGVLRSEQANGFIKNAENKILDARDRVLSVLS